MLASSHWIDPLGTVSLLSTSHSQGGPKGFSARVEYFLFRTCLEVENSLLTGSWMSHRDSIQTTTAQSTANPGSAGESHNNSDSRESCASILQRSGRIRSIRHGSSYRPVVCCHGKKMCKPLSHVSQHCSIFLGKSTEYRSSHGPYACSMQGTARNPPLFTSEAAHPHSRLPSWRGGHASHNIEWATVQAGPECWRLKFEHSSSQRPAELPRTCHATRR